MEEEKLFNDRYKLERLLGRGNFSEVWLATDTKTGIQVALKIYAPATGLDDDGLDVFAREFALVVNANHRNLLKPLYYDSYERKPFLVLPYCNNGSIMKEVGKFSEHDAWQLLHDVASGLAFLHAMTPPIIHQDIKPDNIMKGDTGDYMITDFGVSTRVKSTLRKSMSSAFSSAGTVAYMAPERFSRNNSPIMANDIYSLGATVYEMLSGDAPFGNDGGLLQMKGAEVPELKGDYSDSLKEVVAACLSTNPWERPTAEQLEKYAEEGLKGEKINLKNNSNTTKTTNLINTNKTTKTTDRVENEKTAGSSKKLWFWIGGGAAFVAGITLMIVFISKYHERKVHEEEAAAWVIRQDSIQSAITTLTLKADSLYKAGDAHEEGYEDCFIEALSLYNEALEDVSKLDKPSIDDKIWIKKNIINTKIKLEETKKQLQEQTQQYWENPETYTELSNRIDAINEALSTK